jgi:ABC-type bacteriocin/lantibiotic exporter with double-glycine peptidase domain
MDRLAAILEAPSEGADDSKKPWVDLTPSVDVVCTHLTFHHVGRVELIQDLTHTFPGGDVTALVGPSGGGKTTLAKLLAGLYELQSGNIRYGMFNQRDLSLDCLRQQVVLVPQEPHFWSRSILENFRFSYPGVDFARIVLACQLTGADAFISELPDKYQTVLGEFGVNLSGGQRQRLALARALIADPPVLILDEATDSLDPQSEDLVLDRLFSSRETATTIVISHRPRVIRRSDWLVLIDRGRIVKTGATRALMTEPGDHLAFLDT